MLQRVAQRFRDDGVKNLVMIVGLAIAFAVGILQYVETSKREFKRPFLAKQLELCLSATESAARVSQANKQTDFHDAKSRFLELYWDGLAMVEDQCVTRKMIAFHGTMKKDLEFGDTPSRENLREPALHIAFACRNLISKRWSDVGMLDWSKATEVRGVPINYRSIIEECERE